MLLSLKWKIQLWHTLVLGLVLCLLATGFYFYAQQQRINELDQWLDQQMSPLVGGPSNRPNRSSRPLRLFDDDESFTTPRRRAPLDTPTTQDESPQVESDSAIEPPAGWISVTGHLPSIVGKDVTIPEHPRNHRKKFEQYFVPLGFYCIIANATTGEVEFQTSNAPAIELPTGHYRSYFVRTRDGRYRESLHSNPIKMILVGADLQQFSTSQHELQLQIAACTFAIFIMGIGIGHLLVGRALQPIKSIVQTTNKITSGDLSQRIPPHTKNNTIEFQALSEDLNETFDELESLFERQLRFTADASHELRTPLTALMAQLEHGRDPGRSQEELENVIKVCSRSSERIRHITEQLMELAHYDTKRVQLDYSEMPMDDFLLSLVDELKLYVAQNESTLTTDIGPGSITCDPFRLHQVISNLINNALQHNNTPIQITLKAYRDKADAIIEISDNGKGIQPDNLDKLFDRFYQESTSRSKHSDRYNLGLGLSISQAIIKAHRGSLSVASTPGVLTTFTLRIPDQQSKPDY